MQLLKADFVNHVGQRIKFGQGEGIFLNAHNLRDYQHVAIEKGGRIRGWKRGGITDKVLPLAIFAENEGRANYIKDELFAIAEADILDKNLENNTAGKLYINGYYLDCYIYGQTFTKWNASDKFLRVDCALKSETGLWKKKLSTLKFEGAIVESIPDDDLVGASPNPSVSWTGGTKGYFYGYPYGYAKPIYEHTIENNTGARMGWIAVAYGAANNVTFSIGGIQRTVNVSLGYGEKLEIKALQFEKTIYKIKADGKRENCFAYQNFESDIFAPIETGRQIIGWDGKLTFTLTRIIERSTPEWR